MVYDSDFLSKLMVVILGYCDSGGVAFLAVDMQEIWSDGSEKHYFYNQTDCLTRTLNCY